MTAKILVIALCACVAQAAAFNLRSARNMDALDRTAMLDQIVSPQVGDRVEWDLASVRGLDGAMPGRLDLDNHGEFDDNEISSKAWIPKDTSVKGFSFNLNGKHGGFFIGFAFDSVDGGHGPNSVARALYPSKDDYDPFDNDIRLSGSRYALWAVENKRKADGYARIKMVPAGVYDAASDTLSARINQDDQVEYLVNGKVQYTGNTDETKVVYPWRLQLSHHPPYGRGVVIKNIKYIAGPPVQVGELVKWEARGLDGVSPGELDLDNNGEFQDNEALSKAWIPKDSPVKGFSFSLNGKHGGFFIGFVFDPVDFGDGPNSVARALYPSKDEYDPFDNQKQLSGGRYGLYAIENKRKADGYARIKMVPAGVYDAASDTVSARINQDDQVEYLVNGKVQYKGNTDEAKVVYPWRLQLSHHPPYGRGVVIKNIKYI